ncbi:MAG: lysophospholipase [Defluviitaleaceae bacterium]|nr:lysophospholipase [Defluviitaleaceae bacterium]
MKMKHLAAALIAAVLLLTACSSKEKEATPDPVPLFNLEVDVALDFIVRYTSGLFAGITVNWCEERLAEPGASRLAEPAYINEAGFVRRYTYIGSETAADGGHISHFFIQFERALITAEVWVNASNKITHFIFTDEDYYTSDSDIQYMEEAVFIGAGTQWALEGTFTVPPGASEKEPVPAAVLAAGMYPSDKDGTLFDGKMFFDIADYLSRKGVAVLRYDNRRHAYGEAFIQSFGGELTAWDDIIEDALLAAEILHGDPRFNSVFFIGHGLAASLAPRIHLEGGNFDGLAMLAATVRMYNAFDPEQLMADPLNAVKYPDANVLRDQADWFKAVALTINRMDDGEAKQTNVPLLDVPAYYVKDLLKHPFDSLIKEIAVELPILTINGINDFQVCQLKDFGMVQSSLIRGPGQSDNTFRLFNGLDHRFMLTSATDYETHSRTIMTRKDTRTDAKVVFAIWDWITARAGSGK